MSTSANLRTGAAPSLRAAPELVTLCERALKSFFERDIETFLDALSLEADSLHIGVDGDEWWEGFEQISAIAHVQNRERGLANTHYVIEHVVSWQEGSVGYVAMKLRSTASGHEHLVTRFTVIFHQERAFWRVVHLHASMGVTNEVAVGKSLTVSLEDILTQVQDETPPATATAADGSTIIVFSDIVNSTTMMESLGEAKWLEMLTWHEGVVRRHVATFGGHVIKNQGDGFMIAFAAAGSAAASAVAIQRALQTGWHGVSVPVRVGIHGGNVKAEGGDFFGRTVVVAARLADAAGENEILVSRSLHDVLDGAFAFQSPRSLSLKGLDGHYVAFALDWR